MSSVSCLRYLLGASACKQGKNGGEQKRVYHLICRVPRKPHICWQDDHETPMMSSVLDFLSKLILLEDKSGGLMPDQVVVALPPSRIP